MADDKEDAPAETEGGDAAPEQPFSRSADLLGRKGSRLRAKLNETYHELWRGFEDQAGRADDQMDFWDCYNCVLNRNQFYNGNSEIYVPIVRDAIDACVTRFVNQLFPQAGRYVEAVSSDGKEPFAIIALLDHYIRSARMKTEVARPLVRNGYVEGQYNLCVDWAEIERQIVSRETHGPVAEIDGETVEGDGDEIDDMVEEDIVEGRPVFEVLHDNDVLVLPATADSLDDAFAVGGSVAVVRRWSKGKIREMIEAGEIRDDAGEELIDKLNSAGSERPGGVRDTEKTLAEHVGIKSKGGHAVVWEVWKHLPLSAEGKYQEKDGKLRLCRIWIGPDGLLLGARRNPFWNDRCNLLSCPVNKVAGVFKGMSPVDPIASLQYEANDAANQGADSAHYSALPIVVRDPEQGNGPLVMNLAAIWESPPNAIKFMEFPDLVPRAISRIQFCTQAIFQSLSVNPSMLPQQTSGSKRNQAMVAQEQAVDLLTTAEAVSVLEEGIFTPSMQLCVDFDHQFRDAEITVRAFGAMGLRAEMETVPPLQVRTRYSFRWWGVEQAKNAAQYQQQIAWLNVARGMEAPLKAAGKRLDVAPALEASAQGVFGARLAPLVLVDMRAELTIAAALENQLLADGHDLYVHPLDPDPEHLKEHMQQMQEAGDPHGTLRVHIARHLQSMQMKSEAAMQAQQGAPGVPGGAGRGVAGTPRGGAPPRLGAQPSMPRLIKNHPGAVSPDRMPSHGAVPMPRKM